MAANASQKTCFFHICLKIGFPFAPLRLGLWPNYYCFVKEIPHRIPQSHAMSLVTHHLTLFRNLIIVYVTCRISETLSVYLRLVECLLSISPLHIRRKVQCVLKSLLKLFAIGSNIDNSAKTRKSKEFKMWGSTITLQHLYQDIDPRNSQLYLCVYIYVY